MTKYSIEPAPVDSNAPQTDDTLMHVVRELDGRREVIGSYRRDKDFHTFAAFTKNGKDYALYSPDYTCTRVMTLPDCVDIGGEEPDEGGFCPVDYFVPDESMVGEAAGKVAFVFGCHWACPYQVQMFDLSDVERGILKRLDFVLPGVDMPSYDRDVPEINKFDFAKLRGVRLADHFVFHKCPTGDVRITLRCDLTVHLRLRGNVPEVRGTYQFDTES